MFEAKVFLAGPSRQSEEERNPVWNLWQPHEPPSGPEGVRFVYIADAGLETFLTWFNSLSADAAARLQSVVWCGDGDSLGRHGAELLKSTAARLEGRWREHLYSTDKDFSDCAAMTSMIEYDVRHADELADRMWVSVHGALGGRFDHEMANIFEFTGMLGRVACPATVALGPEIILTTAPVSLTLTAQEKFSVMAALPNQHARVLISGARYSGEFLLRQPSHGLSNVVTAGQAVIQPLTSGLPLLGIIS
jgi:thiamine pyrophosphokinase